MSDGKPDRFVEIKRCLAEAEAVFAKAARCEDASERSRLMDEAEVWLVRAERAFARLTDRMAPPQAPRPLHEHRSFGDVRSEPGAVWRGGEDSAEH